MIGLSTSYCVITFFSGKENSAFVHLVIRFVKTDNQGANYRRKYMGIPQGSPISLLLFNFFLNQLDKKFCSFDILVKESDGIKRMMKIHYARFKDIILFGFPSMKLAHHSAAAKVKTKQILSKQRCKLKLEFSWDEISRFSILSCSWNRPEKLHVLGLVVSLTDEGIVRVYPQKIANFGKNPKYYA